MIFKCTMIRFLRKYWNLCSHNSQWCTQSKVLVMFDGCASALWSNNKVLIFLSIWNINFNIFLEISCHIIISNFISETELAIEILIKKVMPWKHWITCHLISIHLNRNNDFMSFVLYGNVVHSSVKFSQSWNKTILFTMSKLPLSLNFVLVSTPLNPIWIRKKTKLVLNIMGLMVLDYL